MSIFTDGIIENLNYLNDSRTQGPAEAPMLRIYDDDDDYEEVALPMKWGVCDVCNGEGKHVNPSIDCGGLSLTHQDDPDFLEDYLGGSFDIPCNQCSGKRVVQEIDEGRMSEEQLELWNQQRQDDYECRMEQRAEMMMGA